MTKHTAHDHATHTRLIVRVVQDVIRAQRFDSQSDLKETVKERCARLRIAYDAGRIAEALDRVELGGRRPIVPHGTSGRVPVACLAGTSSAPLLVGDGDQPARMPEGRWNEAERALFRQQWRLLMERRR